MDPLGDPLTTRLIQTGWEFTMEPYPSGQFALIDDPDRQIGNGSVWTRTWTRSDGPEPFLTPGKHRKRKRRYHTTRPAGSIESGTELIGSEDGSNSVHNSLYNKTIWDTRCHWMQCSPWWESIYPRVCRVYTPRDSIHLRCPCVSIPPLSLRSLPRWAVVVVGNWFSCHTDKAVKSFHSTMISMSSTLSAITSGMTKAGTNN
jgi:hypothetical protein